MKLPLKVEKIGRIVAGLTQPISEAPPLNLRSLPADEQLRREILETMEAAQVVCVRGRVDEPEKITIAIDLR